MNALPSDRYVLQCIYAVNFPNLASVLAGENRDYLRFILPLGLSSLALVVSVVSLVVGMLLKR